jgi:hypothetical protein
VGKWTQQAKKKGAGNGGDDKPLPPAGDDQSAVLVALVDLGTQRNDYEGKAAWARKLFFVWELVETKERALPWKDFTFSLHENALLRKFVDAWRSKPLEDGEDFDINVLVGKACLLSIVHKPNKDKTRSFAVVTGVKKPVFRGQKVEIAAPQHKPFCWHLDDGKENALPDWLPWLYGRSIPEWIADSKERGGTRECEPGEEGDEQETAAGFGPAPAQGTEIPF